MQVHEIMDSIEIVFLIVVVVILIQTKKLLKVVAKTQTWETISNQLDYTKHQLISIMEFLNHNSNKK
jgi:hypothetical protein